MGPWGSKGLSSPFPYENCCSKRWKNMKSSDHGNAAWFSGIRDFSWHNHLGVCVSFMPAHITLKDSPVQTYILKITTSSPELFSMLLTYHIHTHILTPHTHIDQQRAAFSCPVPREVVAVFFYFFSPIGALGFLLTPHSGITPRRARGTLVCQRWNQGLFCLRQESSLRAVPLFHPLQGLVFFFFFFFHVI